jgi:hypothetical protein
MGLGLDPEPKVPRKPIVYAVPLEGELKQDGVKYLAVEYSEELAEDIVTRLEIGNTYRQIETVVGMPSRRTLQEWRKKYPEFAAKCDAAYDTGSHWLHDHYLHTAYRSDIGHKEKHEILDAIKWTLTKRGGNKYRDKILQEHVGEDGGPLKLIVERIEIVGKPNQD